MPEPYQKNNLTAAIEALLFLYGEPLTTVRIASMLAADAAANELESPTEEAVREAIVSLEQSFEQRGSGLRLIRNGDEIQIVTAPMLSPLVANFIKAEMAESLTPAALETMAIIAYGGPMPRSVVDFIRGVNSSFIIRSLLIRGLIEREPDPARANVYRYRASMNLIRHLGISSIADLPDYASFRTLIEKLQQPSINTSS